MSDTPTESTGAASSRDSTRAPCSAVPYPWPPNRFDVDQAVKWGDTLQECKREGEDAMACVLAWEVRRLRKVVHQIAQLCENCKNVSDAKDIAERGLYPPNK